MFAPWRRFRRKVREVGWLYAVQLLSARLTPDGIFGVNKLLITKSDVRVRSAHEITDAKMRIVSATDPPGADDWPRHLRTAVEEGEEVAVFERGGRLIAYRIFAIGSYDRVRWLRFRLPPNAVFIGYVWVAPEFRGREIGPGSRNALAVYHAERGVVLFVSSIDALNHNSRRAHEKHGGGYAGVLSYIRVLGLSLVRLDGTVRFGVWGSKRPLDIHIDPDGSVRFAGRR